MVAKDMVGNGKVGLLGVIHAKTIVMLGGEKHIFHAGVLASGRPLFRRELRWIELPAQPPIPVFILLIGHGGIAGNPIFVADRPRLNNARQCI